MNISCKSSPSGIVITRSSNLTINGINLMECRVNLSKYFNSTDSTRLEFPLQIITYGLLLIDVMGKSILSEISTNDVFVAHITDQPLVHESPESKLVLQRITWLETKQKYNNYKIALVLNHSFIFEVLIRHIYFRNVAAIYVEDNTCTGNNSIQVIDCHFVNIKLSKAVYYKSFEIIFVKVNSTNCKSFTKCWHHKLLIYNCSFGTNNIKGYFLLLNFYITTHTFVMLDQCIFYNNSNIKHLTVKSQGVGNVTFIIKDTVFLHLQHLPYVLNGNGLNITFKGYVIFRNLKSSQILISIKKCSFIIDGYTEFAAIYSGVLISTDQIQLQSNANINITKTNCSTALFSFQLEKLIYNVPKELFSPLYPPCLFQYMNGTVMTNQYSIVIKETYAPNLCTKYFCISHCYLDNTTENMYTSWEINQKVIIVDNSSKNLIRDYKTICFCTDSQNYHCLAEELPAVYPGQTLNISFALKFDSQLSSIVNAEYNYHNLPRSACKIINTSEIQQEIYSTCTHVSYTVEYNNLGWCELFFSHLEQRYFTDHDSKSYYFVKKYNAYYVKYLPCPLGFKISGNNICNCDPELILALSNSELHCNINDQTLLRPANSWISVDTNTNHSYYASQYCPFDFCLPHSSSLNLASPDSQCQFKRTGLLCGKCKDGLTVVFGSSHCKQCSNLYLLIIIPIGIAGVLLVLLLFILNFTVTDGDINAFLFYVNIFEINNSIFLQSGKTSHIIISLANLDLGFETCFYNGMDDYAKMCLQLVFPAYLVMIAVVLIMASRYSTKMQRLTARRALPVLATLFLLSYTKVLRTVSYMLFFYLKIKHIPTNHTVLVWSVDTKTQIFGARYTVAFIVSLILFLILLSFNIILLFRRFFSYFNFVNQFKPLLDAYQGPYQDKFYYWTGLQLVMRAVFFGLSALDRNTNLMISTHLIGVVVGIHGMVHPFKSKKRNIQEFLILLNLQAIFVFSMYRSSNHVAISVLTLLTLLYFISIILQHINKQWCEKYYPNCTDTLKSNLNVMLGRYLGYFKQPKQGRSSFHPNIELIPEVTYNYKEFQESLIGLDE